MNVFVALGGAGGNRWSDRVVRKAVSAAGHALSTLAPSLACWLAAWIWSSPPRAKRGPVPEHAERLTLRIDKCVAQGYLWRGRDAVAPRVLVQHGWGGAVSAMAPIIHALVESGSTVVAFDVFNHGGTGRGRYGKRQSSLIEMSDLAIKAAREYGPIDAVIAHSAGAAAIARAMRHGLQAVRCVFIAPLVKPLEQTHRLSGMLGLTASVSTRWPEVLMARFGSSRADIDMCVRPPRMPQTLIVQDQDDRFSPPHGAHLLHAAWPGSELMTTQGLGHVRIQADPYVLERIVEFVRARTPHYAPLIVSEQSASAS